MLDDDRWKAVTTVGYLAHPETLKHRPCRSHAVNVTMPVEELIEEGDAVMAWAAPTEQGYDFATVGRNRRMPVDFDGLKLVVFAPQDSPDSPH